MIEPPPEQQAQPVPPNCTELEKDLLGTILIAEGAMGKVAHKIDAEDFYVPAHRVIFEAAVALHEENQPCNLVTVTSSMRDAGTLKKCGGAAYLTSLTDIIPFAGTLGHHAKQIKEKANLRKLIALCDDVRGRCMSGAAGGEELITQAEESIFELSSQRNSEGFESVGPVAERVFDRIEKMSNTLGTITGVSTGYGDIDQMTSGFQSSDLIILAARPSMGKTALAMNIIQYAAMQSGVRVGMFSLEMSKDALVTRLFSSVGMINSHGLRNGQLRDDDWPKMVNAAGKIKGAPVWIDDTAGITVTEMRAKARRLKAKHGIGMIVVDYLQLMQGRSRSENRTQEISDISRSLKAMAKELNIPVVVLSQLNRMLENRPDKHPQLSDLRESGAIEQDADVIMFIYRDEVYNKSEDNPNMGTAEVIVAKQRNGPTGTVRLGWVAETTTFVNL